MWPHASWTDDSDCRTEEGEATRKQQQQQQPAVRTARPSSLSSLRFTLKHPVPAAAHRRHMHRDCTDHDGVGWRVKWSGCECGWMGDEVRRGEPTATDSGRAVSVIVAAILRMRALPPSARIRIHIRLLLAALLCTDAD